MKMLKNDNISRISLFNLVQNDTNILTSFQKKKKSDSAYTEQFLVFNSDIIAIKDLRFRDYFSMLCSTHLSDEIEIEFCFDTESDSSLTSTKTIEKYFSHLSVYVMSDEQKIRCRELESDKLEFNSWIELSIRILTTEETYVILKEKFHIMSNLSCDIVMRTDIMKSFDISLVWDKNNSSNHVFIQKNHTIKMRATNQNSLRFRKILEDSWITVHAVKIRSSSRRKSINVYANIFEILSFDFEQNVSVRHKLIIKENYVFESISQRDSILDVHATTTHAVITNQTNFISLTNFEFFLIKVRQNQLLSRMKRMNSLKITSSDSLKFDYFDVFLDKFSVKKSDEKESEFSFSFKTSNDTSQESDISLSWDLDYIKKIKCILNKHSVLFRKKLDKFNDVEMSISFRDEKDIENLKQSSYSMFVRNKKTMNEILDLLISSDQI
jgi:hypothetical protein